MAKLQKKQKKDNIQANLSSLSYLSLLNCNLSHTEVGIFLADDKPSLIDEKLATNRTIMKAVDKAFNGI